MIELANVRQRNRKEVLICVLSLTPLILVPLSDVQRTVCCGAGNFLEARVSWGNFAKME